MHHGLFRASTTSLGIVTNVQIIRGHIVIEGVVYLRIYGMSVKGWKRVEFERVQIQRGMRGKRNAEE